MVDYSKWWSVHEFCVVLCVREIREPILLPSPALPTCRYGDHPLPFSSSPNSSTQLNRPQWQWHCFLPRPAFTSSLKYVTSQSPLRCLPFFSRSHLHSLPPASFFSPPKLDALPSWAEQQPQSPPSNNLRSLQLQSPKNRFKPSSFPSELPPIREVPWRRTYC